MVCFLRGGWEGVKVDHCPISKIRGHALQVVPPVDLEEVYYTMEEY